MSDETRPNAPADRVGAPMYLAKFREREAERLANISNDVTDEPTNEPIYLRQFRERRDASSIATPLWERGSLEIQQALTEDNRNKEIVPPEAVRRTVNNDVFLIRHGETQGYSTDSGLTPQGVWQAHTYGHTLAKRIKSGETVVFRHADTNRARETAEHIYRGLADGLVMFEKEITIHEPEPIHAFRNFQFSSPSGLSDVTAAFREYYSLVEGIERTAAGDRPLWLVEMDRFWRTQQGGGDPIQHWLTTPLLHFEPPSLCVRRFWQGITDLSSEFPGARLLIATHSGPIRAFAVAALGYDPGEPYNTEHVRVKLYESSRNDDVDALVAYRNRVQEIKVPVMEELTAWQAAAEGRPEDFGKEPKGVRVA